MAVPDVALTTVVGGVMSLLNCWTANQVGSMALTVLVAFV